MINIYCAAASNDIPNGGCGIVLVWSDEFGRSQRREMAFALPGASLGMAEFHAVKLALASVAPVYRKEATRLHTTSPSLAELLTRKGTAIERWYGFFPDAAAEVHSDSTELLAVASALAGKATETQRDYDSQTRAETGNGKPAR